MAVNLNLLPDNFAVKGSLGKTLTSVKQLTTIFLGLFILMVIGISTYFFISSLELGSLTSSIDNLKVQITQQETVETQMVLLKDRIGKIKTVQKIASAQNSLNGISPVISSIPDGSSLGELSVDNQKSDASIIFNSSVSLGIFFKQLVTSTTFSSIVLNSFGFNPSTGYLASLRFVGK